MNVRLQYNTIFTAGIFYGGQLRMNNYQVRLSLITIAPDGEDHNVALERIKFFIHNQLASSVLINGADHEQCQRLISAGVRITNLPEDPIDQIVGIMLYCKLNAIIEDRMAVHEIEIASELGDHIVYFHCDDEAQGPLVDAGWWNNSDTSHCDLTNLESKTVDIQQIMSWKDLNLDWEADQVDIVSQDNKVLFADFARDETR
jgi:hypothetical protein